MFSNLYQSTQIQACPPCPREATVKKVICLNGMPVVEGVELARDETEYFYQPATNETFGGGPFGVLDPFEKKYIMLGQSTMPDSGEGNAFPWIKLLNDYYRSTNGTTNGDK